MNTLRWILLIVGALLLFAIYWFDRKRRPSAHHRLLDDLEQEHEELEAEEDLESPRSTMDHGGLGDRREPSFGGAGRLFGAVDDKADVRESPIPVLKASKPIREEMIEQRPEQDRFAEKMQAYQRNAAISGSSSSKSAGEERLVVLYVVAHGASEFTGEALAEAFAQAELQYGDWQVFQRTVKFGGKDEVLFRVANMLKPGTFDLSRLRELRCRGLSLFMKLPGPIDALKAFNTMLHCAQVLAEKLSGDVLDASREPLDQVNIEILRGDIQLYGLKLRQTGQDDRQPGQDD